MWGEIVVSRRSVGLPALTVILAMAMASLNAGSASAASWLEELFYLSGPRYDGVVPPCDYPDALVKISVYFNNKENTFWNTDLRIVAFEKVRETAFRAWAANAIPRRYCSGIVEDTGMVGATWGVAWCVVGLDRNWAYNPACQMARP